jgi:glutathione S-transferase
MSMKLFYAPTSPFVRKCLVCAIEAGMREGIELVPAAAHPVNRDRALVAQNPLGQVPTLVSDDGTVLYDSRVICEFLDAASGGRLIPKDGPARWGALVEQALADGILAAAVLTRYETAVRPAHLRWDDWVSGQLDKVATGLADLERRAPALGGRVDLGTIAVACALGYLDFRYASLDWRARHPRTAAWFDPFSRRESMLATLPPQA